MFTSALVRRTSTRRIVQMITSVSALCTHIVVINRAFRTNCARAVIAFASISPTFVGGIVEGITCMTLALNACDSVVRSATRATGCNTMRTLANV